MTKPLSKILEELSENTTWEQFEAKPLGHLMLSEEQRHESRAGENADPYSYDFYMRVGTHLGRPTQAIFSCGKFVRFRKPLQDYSMFGLAKIDPHRPKDSLYRNHGVGQWGTSVYNQNIYTGNIYTGTVAGAQQVQPFTEHWNPALVLGYPYLQAGQLIPTIIPGALQGQLSGNNTGVGWTTQTAVLPSQSPLYTTSGNATTLGLGHTPFIGIK